MIPLVLNTPGWSASGVPTGVFLESCPWLACECVGLACEYGVSGSFVFGRDTLVFEVLISECGCDIQEFVSAISVPSG